MSVSEKYEYEIRTTLFWADMRVIRIHDLLEEKHVFSWPPYNVCFASEETLVIVIEF